jgi:response regulator of citrate/malate metabolism
MSVKLLLVEDDAWLAELYQTVLSSSKTCEVLHATTADAALDLLDQNSDVDLIILDMFLPEHNGIEFLHELASYTDTNTVPVIVLSSVYEHDFKMTEERWKHYGVVKYLYKPETKPKDLVAEVKKQLSVATL